METIKLDLIPRGKMPSLHASQYDDGRAYHIDLTENRVPYVLDGTETISLTVRKCDNTLVTMDIANTFANQSYIEFITTEQMCAVAGFNVGEIVLEENGDRIGSLNFYLLVEQAPDEGGLTSQSEINNLARQVHDFVAEELEDNGAEETGYDNSESGLTATNVQDAIDEVNTKIENIPSVDAYTKQESDSFLADEYDATQTYAIGDYCIHEGGLYICNTAISTAEAWNASHWTLTDVGTALGDKADASEVNQALGELDEAVSDIGDKFDDFTEILPIGKEWQEQEADNNATNKRATYNAQYQRIIFANDQQGYGCKVYPVTAGKYRVTGYGFDVNTTGVLAVVGNADIIGNGATYCNLLQVVQAGSNSYTWHTVIVDITNDGYLYVNYSTTSGDRTSKVEKEVTVGQTVAITDNTLTSEYLPANAKAVGDAIRNATQKNGIIKNGTTYQHFSYSHDNKYIFRTIAPVGANGLYDYKSVAVGHFENGSAVIDTTFFTAFTDQIGPVSMRLSGDSGSNLWTGGVHTTNIGGTDYPTAQVQSIAVFVDGVDISNSEDGIYYGDCRIITKNNLYAPATITGADLSTATLAIVETRTFILTDTLKIQVKLEFKENSIVGLYYGMQNQDNHTNTILLPTAGLELARADMTSGAVSNSKEWAIMLSDNNNYHFDMLLDYFGLGDWNKNDGTSAYGRINHYSTTKIYFVLCSGGTFNQGDIMFWQGEYRTYHN